MGRRKGFTLVEIIVTAGILSLVMAMTLPYYRSYSSSWSCKSATQILYGDLLYQRQRAFSTCLNTGITINKDGCYVLWETYYTSSLPASPVPVPAAVKEEPAPLVFQILMALIPAGCGGTGSSPVVYNPTDTKAIKTVNLSDNLTAKVALESTIKDLQVTFAPRRSDDTGRWAFSSTTPGDIAVACGAEVNIITITADGDIVSR